ncbi:MAG TPA: hypothetical protein VN155_16205, partial [Devosia sp.]|nr:hypothetical protein [Devosia sp.]
LAYYAFHRSAHRVRWFWVEPEGDAVGRWDWGILGDLVEWAIGIVPPFAQHPRCHSMLKTILTLDASG